MESEPQIEFQGMTPTDTLNKRIADHIAGIEKRFGRLTACRIVVRAPGSHHKVGSPYEVTIKLTLPGGREVNVGRTTSADERHGQLMFAVNDAFKRARRRLQDQVRRMQGMVKAHEGPPIATVTRIDDGFGMLTTDDGREIYFHRNSVLNDAFSRLELGTRVTYAEEMGEKGPQASTVKLLGKHGMR